MMARTTTVLLMGLAASLCAVASAAQDTLDLSAVAGDVRILGDDVDGLMGSAIAAGDVNGDGYEDIVVGAPAASPGGLGTAGEVYVIYGTDTALPASIDVAAGGADVVISGAAAGDQLGRAVATGDVNDDNFADLILGAPFSDPDSRNGAGSVYVIYGGAGLAPTWDLAATPADLTLIGPGVASGENLGWRVAAGDVDNDGFADILATAWRAAGLRGQVFMVLGSATLPDTVDTGDSEADLEITGADLQDFLGDSITAGDFNVDGFDDIIAGATGADPGSQLSAGEVFVFFGSADPSGVIDLSTGAAPDVLIQGSLQTDLAGRAVAIGDMNFDGKDDLAISANGADPLGRTNAGEVYVIFGSAIPSGTVLRLSDDADVDVNIAGPTASAGFGWAMSTLNYNGDGMADLAISAAGASTPAGAGTGWIGIVEGNRQLPDLIDMDGGADQIVLGDDAGDNAGYSLGRGDLDGDGVEDLLIGAWLADQTEESAGEAYAIYGIPPWVELSVPDTTATYNESLRVPVRVDSTNGLKMVDIDFALLYDPNLLSYSGVDTTGTLTAGWTTITTAVTSGPSLDTLRISSSTNGAAAETEGTLYHVDFSLPDIRHPAGSVLTVDSLHFNGGRPAWNQITDGAVKLVGNDGHILMTVIAMPGDSVRVRVTDVDGNLDPAQADSITVEIVNAPTGEIEHLVLHEKSLDDSVFFAHVPTSSSDPGIDDDGIFLAQDDDSLMATFVDSLDAAGDLVSRLDSTYILDPLGDVDDNGATQAFDAARILAHAIGLVTLADRDSLTANVDLEAPYGPINAFDASLVIQRRIGRRSHFPVQEDSSANHPQPETDDSVPRRLAVGRTLTSVLGPGWVSLRLEDRSHIVAGDLVIDGLMRPTAVYAADDLPGALVATNEVPGSLRIAFAAEAPAEGPGELLRIKLPGDAIPVSVHVEGDFNGGRLPALSQVAQSGSTNPRSLRLYPNHPNPFNAQTAIRFDLPAAAHVQLRIYNGLGQRVRTLLDGPMRSGVHSVVWDGTDDRRRHLSSGTYVSVLQAPDGRRTHTLLLVK